MEVCNDQGPPCLYSTEECDCVSGIGRAGNICPEDVVPTPVILRIVGTTEDCGGPAPGPDIIAVQLEDEEDTVLGWARLIGDNVQFEDNDFPPPDVLDGTAPELDGARCPTPSSKRVALGCAGNDAFVAVEFIDSRAARR